MKVLYHYDVGPWLRDRLNRMAKEEGLRVAICSERDHDGFLEQMADTDVLLHNLEPVKEEHMAAAPKLKLVQKIGVGVNTIDHDIGVIHLEVRIHKHGLCIGKGRDLCDPTSEVHFRQRINADLNRLSDFDFPK